MLPFLASDPCAGTECSHECDPVSGDCTCRDGFTVDGNNCIGNIVQGSN